MCVKARRHLSRTIIRGKQLSAARLVDYVASVKPGSATRRHRA